MKWPGDRLRSGDHGQRDRPQLLAFQVLRGHAGAGEGLLAILDGRAAHIAFHVREPRATGATVAVNAGRATLQVAEADRAHVVELRRIPPEVDERLLADIADLVRELHAGE